MKLIPWVNWFNQWPDLKEKSLERETTIGGPISIFQAATYHKQVVGILVLKRRLREIVPVLQPHPLIPNPTPSYYVSEPGTAQEVSFWLSVSVRIWESRDLLLQNSTQKYFLKSFYVLSAAFLLLQLISFLWYYTGSQVGDLPLPSPLSPFPELRTLCLFLEEYQGLLKFPSLWGTDSGSNTAEVGVQGAWVRIC